MASIADDQKCQFTHLGNSGLRVSNICLGAMTFGESSFGMGSQLSEEASHKIMDRYLEWGGNFIDTANIYGRGASERIVGSWLTKQTRDKVVVATKVRVTMDNTNPNAGGLGRRHIIESVERSLERLQTSYIDLMQIHAWDDAVPIEETLMTLHDLVRCGKVRHLGASNVTGWQLQKIVDISKEKNYSPFVSLQQQYNLVSRWSELEPFQVCKLNGMGVLPWSPLKSGFLAGKVKKEEDPKEGRLALSAQKAKDNPNSGTVWIGINNEKNWNILDTVKTIADKKGKSPAQVSLRWLLQKSVVSSVIIGATKLGQLDDNMATANGWTLTDEEMKELDEISQLDVPYPYEMIWMVNKGRDNPWNPQPYV